MLVVRLVPVALRLGALATTAYAAWRLSQSAGGRLDQQVEDALDELDEGVAMTQSQIHGETDENRQYNANARFRRRVRVGGRTLEIDASAIARLRLRRI